MPTNRHVRVGSRRDGRWAPMVGPYKVGCFFLNYNFHFTYNYLRIDYTYNKYKHAKLWQQLRQVPLMHRTSNSGNSSNSNMGSRCSMSCAFSKFLFHFILLLHYLNSGGSSSDSGSHHHDEVLVVVHFFIENDCLLYYINWTFFPRGFRD